MPLGLGGCSGLSSHLMASNENLQIHRFDLHVTFMETAAKFSRAAWCNMLFATGIAIPHQHSISAVARQVAQNIA